MSISVPMCHSRVPRTYLLMQVLDEGCDDLDLILVPGPCHLMNLWIFLDR